ncbi:pectate lyase family protein [Streptomyces sp. IBSBF 2435]|uniref:pectate lyase family protein n=1 Tax=Streptomyces sp. IBSBF 2435 TaxID=2903531 RepID=UPI003FA7E3CE
MKLTSPHLSRVSALRRGPGLTAAATLGALALAVVPAVSGAGQAQAASFESSPVGYGAGTTGGGSAPATTVSSLSAFKSAVTGSTAKVVRISGLISLSGQVDVGSNTTVLGVGSNSGLTGGGIRLKNAQNVILRNLVISKAVGTDAITVQKSTQVWIDHNDLSSDQTHGKDYYDGLLDITHAADNVSVSWNKFHDHYKVSLVGHSDDNASEDTGHLRVTYSHNWFTNVNSRLPSLRFGKSHIFNNYFQNAGDSGVHSRMGAEVFVQANVFTNVPDAITTTGDSDVDGYANQADNIFDNSTTDITRTSSYKPTYSWSPESASTVAATVSAGAGTGKV